MANFTSVPPPAAAQVLSALLQDCSLGLQLASADNTSASGQEAGLKVHLFDKLDSGRFVPDCIWTAAEKAACGFLICMLPTGIDSSGTGLRHRLGMGHLAISGMHGGRAYQLGSAAELDAIVRHGVRRMVDQRQGEFFYLTVEDEARDGIALSAADRDGAVRGIYRLRMGNGLPLRRIQLLSNGGSIRAILEAAKVLEEQHAITPDIWCVTSYQELARDGMQAAQATCDSHAPNSDSWFARQMANTAGPIIAMSGYSRVLPEMIRPLVSNGRSFRTLKTEAGMENASGPSRSAMLKMDVDNIIRAARDDVEAAAAEERVREGRRFASIISLACI